MLNGNGDRLKVIGRAKSYKTIHKYWLTGQSQCDGMVLLPVPPSSAAVDIWLCVAIHKRHNQQLLLLTFSPYPAFAAYLPFGQPECVNRVLGTVGRKEFHKLLFAEITGSIIRRTFF